MELRDHPRRRTRSSQNESFVSAGIPSNTSAITALEHQERDRHREHHADIALGFVDIYQSLTPRQVGIIGRS